MLQILSTSPSKQDPMQADCSCQTDSLITVPTALCASPSSQSARCTDS